MEKNIPAFPIPGQTYAFPEGSFTENTNYGMTLRDYFAAKALQGMLANGDWVDRMATRSGLEADVCASKAAYEVADAMLAARDA
ncbi:hypothetical protein ACQCLI_18275 [Pseudomonas nitroreducens]|uniref:hypothetical protein n=1 Tax=Pseudomonas nitroreducens TaxID=46680 RepID=UPI0003636181|nr:hypothetical protein [Pseudomonas nitroreducens]